MPSKTHAELFAASFDSPEPLWELRGVARTLLAQGYDRQALTSELEQFMNSLEAAGREADWEVVYQLLGCFAGWCLPHLVL